MHFTGLVHTKFSEKTKNTKITKFSIPINLVTLRQLTESTCSYLIEL